LKSLGESKPLSPLQQETEDFAFGRLLTCAMMQIYAVTSCCQAALHEKPIMVGRYSRPRLGVPASRFHGSRRPGAATSASRVLERGDRVAGSRRPLDQAPEEIAIRPAAATRPHAGSRVGVLRSMSNFRKAGSALVVASGPSPAAPPLAFTDSRRAP
jgi:hypothetical protein